MVIQCLDKSEYEKGSCIVRIAFAYENTTHFALQINHAPRLSVMKFNLMNDKKEHIDKFQTVVTEKFKDRAKLCQDCKHSTTYILSTLYDSAWYSSDYSTNTTQ